KTVNICKKPSITGADFKHGVPLAVTIESKQGDVIELGTVQVEEDGTFDTSFTIPSDAHPGPYTVIVTQQDGDQATAEVKVNRGGGIGGVIRDIVDWLRNLLFGWW